VTPSPDQSPGAADKIAQGGTSRRAGSSPVKGQTDHDRDFRSRRAPGSGMISPPPCIRHLLDRGYGAVNLRLKAGQPPGVAGVGDEKRVAEKGVGTVQGRG